MQASILLKPQRRYDTMLDYRNDKSTLHKRTEWSSLQEDRYMVGGIGDGAHLNDVTEAQWHILFVV